MCLLFCRNVSMQCTAAACNTRTMRGGSKQHKNAVVEEENKKQKYTQKKSHRPKIQRWKHNLSELTLTKRSLIGSKALDVQLEFQRDEYSRARGKQESMRTPQTLRSAINPTYCITGLSLRIGASKQHKIKGAERKNFIFSEYIHPHNFPSKKYSPFQFYHTFHTEYKCASGYHLFVSYLK